jgi:hypothetical protein
MFVEVTGQLADDARAGLEAAYPHLLAAFRKEHAEDAKRLYEELCEEALVDVKERLLSNEAVEAALDSYLDGRVDTPQGEELNVIRQDVREGLEAALASIDSDGGTT